MRKRRRWAETLRSENTALQDQRASIAITDVAKHRVYELSKTIINDEGVAYFSLPRKVAQSYPEKQKNFRFVNACLKETKGCHNSAALVLWLKPNYYNQDQATLMSAAAAICEEMQALCYALSTKSNNWIKNPDKPSQPFPGVKFEVVATEGIFGESAKESPLFVLLYTDVRDHQANFVKKMSYELFQNPTRAENASKRGLAAKFRRHGIEYRHTPTAQVR